MSAGAGLGEEVARAIDVSRVDTPCFITDLGALQRNLEVLADVQRRAGCTILLALKGFAQWSTFPLWRPPLPRRRDGELGRRGAAGAATSSAARSTRYAPAYSDGDMAELVTLADHIVLNSPAQWRRHRAAIARAGRSAGLRVNHEHQEVEVALYDPAGPCSRLGTTRGNLAPFLLGGDLDGISGLALSTRCAARATAMRSAARSPRSRPGSGRPASRG